MNVPIPLFHSPNPAILTCKTSVRFQVSTEPQLPVVLHSYFVFCTNQVYNRVSNTRTDAFFWIRVAFWRVRLQANVRPQALILQTVCPWSHCYLSDTCHRSWPWDYPKLLWCRVSHISWNHLHAWFVVSYCQGRRRSTSFSTPRRRKVEATSGTGDDTFNLLQGKCVAVACLLLATSALAGTPLSTSGRLVSCLKSQINDISCMKTVGKIRA